MAEQSSSPADLAQLRNGLIVPDRFHMPTLFSLIMFWWTFWMMALVFVPFLLTENIDSYWSEPRTVAIFSCIVVVSTGHGALGYIMGYLRGAKISNFVIGALLGPLGLILLSVLLKDNPESIPSRPTGLVKAMDRLAFACGNLWFGIAQIVLMIGFLIRATVYETEFADKGNEAAYAAYYNTPMMGLIFVLFFITIYAATMRKYPFRWHQVGWLMTHAGLMFLMVGCMIMYWGSFSGFVYVHEGHTVDHVYSRDVRDLDVRIPALGYAEKHRISIDRDPEARDVSQTIPIKVEHNGSKYEGKIEIDRYLSRAEFYSGIKALTSDKINELKGQAGVELTLGGPSGFKKNFILLESHNQGGAEFQNIFMRVATFARQHMIDSVGHRYAADDLARGELIVSNNLGQPMARIPVGLTPENPMGTEGRPVAKAAQQLSAQGPTVTVQRFFNTMAPGSGGLMVDADASAARHPGVLVAIDGANGRNEVYVDARGGGTISQENAYGLRFEYHCRGEIALPEGMVLVALHPNKKWTISLGAKSGTIHEPLVKGRSYAFSENAPVRIVVNKFLERAEYEEDVRETKKKENFQALRAKVSFESDSKEDWLINGLLRPQEFRLGGHRMTIGYGARKIPLGFTISCIDFRHETYANAPGRAKAYETNVILRDQEEGIEEAVLIDMNHPLAHRGYQFFNGSPIGDRAKHKRGVVFSIGRNPGYAYILIASTITCLGIITVFFFKKRIREWDTRRRAAAQV